MQVQHSQLVGHDRILLANIGVNGSVPEALVKTLLQRSGLPTNTPFAIGNPGEVDLFGPKEGKLRGVRVSKESFPVPQEAVA